MASEERKEKLDNVLAYILLKKIITPITKTEAYKQGLVDRDGKILKDIDTEDFSLLDKLVFKIKRLLGSRVAKLNSFIYLKSLDDDFYDSLIVTGSLSKRHAVRRVQRDLEKLMEKYDLSFDEYCKSLVLEQIKQKRKEQKIL